MNSKMHGPADRTTRDAGFALPLVVFALVLLGVMGVAGLQSSSDEFRSAVAVNSSRQAFYAAEAGLHDALSNWDPAAMDTLVASPGDSIVGEWTAMENRCTYQVVYRRIDAGDSGRRLYSIESTGLGPGLTGGRRRVGIITKSWEYVTSAIAFGGALEISANAKVTGLCGAVHSNGDLVVNGNPIIGGVLNTSGTAVVSGSPVDTLGSPITANPGAPELPIPDLAANDYCGDADYIFDDNGEGLEVSSGVTFDFGPGDPKWGWKWDPGTNRYYADSQFPEEGVYCVDGNVQVSTDLGAPGSPAVISLLSTMSIEISSNSYLEPAHRDSILILAEGDLKMNGNPIGGAHSFEGLSYGGSQCEVSGTASLHGQLICRDDPNPTGSLEWVTDNKLSGDVEITYSCGGFLSKQVPEPILERTWTHLW